MTIEKTIGTGGDYALLSTAFATLFYEDDPGENITFDLISSIDDDITGVNIFKLFNRKVTVKCSYNELHRNNHSSLYVINQTGPTAIYGQYWANTYGFTLEFDFLKFKFLNLTSSLSYYIYGFLQPGTPTSQFMYFNIFNCIFQSSPKDHIIIATGGANAITNVLNCQFFNVASAIILSGDKDTDNSTTIENCTMYGGTSGLTKGTGTAWTRAIIKNTVAAKNTTKDFNFTDLTGAAIINCADSDNSIASSGANLTDNITGIVEGDFVSVDPDSDDFLKIGESSALYNKGTADISAWNTEDAKGDPRPTLLGVVSIGAYEIVISGVLPGKKLLENKQALGFKLETMPFTAEVLTVDNYKYQAYDIKVATDIGIYARKLCSGDFSRFPSISGKRACAVNFKVDAYAMADPATPPAYFEMLRACGWRQVVYDVTGVSVRPDAFYNRTPATIEVVYEDESSEPRQLVYKISGAMGMVKMSSVSGQPLRLEFSFLGALEGVTTRAYADRIVPAEFDGVIPKALLGATVNFLGYAATVEAFEVAGNEVVNLFSNIFRAHGYDGSRVSGRALEGKIKIGTLDNV